MKSRLQSALLFVGTINCNRLSSYVYLSCLAALEARNFSANSEPGLKFWVQGLGKDFNGGWERVSRNPKPERHWVEASGHSATFQFLAYQQLLAEQTGSFRLVIWT